MDAVDESFKRPIDNSDKLLDPQSEDTTPTLLETMHVQEDLKLPLDRKAPPVVNPYSMENSMRDLPCAAYALELFLASHMLESEDYMHKGDPKK